MAADKKEDPVKYLHDAKYMDEARNNVKIGRPGECAMVADYFPDANSPNKVPVIILFVNRPKDTGQGYSELAQVRYAYHRTRGWISPDNDLLTQDLAKGAITTYGEAQLRELLSTLPQKNLTYLIPPPRDQISKDILQPPAAPLQTMAVKQDGPAINKREEESSHPLLKKITDADKTPAHNLSHYFRRLLSEPPHHPNAIKQAELADKIFTLTKDIKSTSGFFSRPTPQSTASAIMRKAVENLIVDDVKHDYTVNESIQTTISAIYNAVKHLDANDMLEKTSWIN